MDTRLRRANASRAWPQRVGPHTAPNNVGGSRGEVHGPVQRVRVGQGADGFSAAAGPRLLAAAGDRTGRCAAIAAET